MPTEISLLNAVSVEDFSVPVLADQNFGESLSTVKKRSNYLKF